MEKKGRRELEVEKESIGEAVKKGIRGIGGRGGAEKDRKETERGDEERKQKKRER